MKENLLRMLYIINSEKNELLRGSMIYNLIEYIKENMD